MAAKACGGKVIVQVKYTCDRLMTDKVAIPGIFVDAVVISKDPVENHRQTQLFFYDPSMSGHSFVPTDDIASLPLSMPPFPRIPKFPVSEQYADVLHLHKPLTFYTSVCLTYHPEACLFLHV